MRELFFHPDHPSLYWDFFRVSVPITIALTAGSCYFCSGCCRGGRQFAVSTEEFWAHKGLLLRYLVVYLTATMADWLQGPFVYALYASYGYDQQGIAVLFVAAFASSLVLGTLVAFWADWVGRRRFVVLFAVLYAASCATQREFLCFVFLGVTHYLKRWLQ